MLHYKIGQLEEKTKQGTLTGMHDGKSSDVYYMKISDLIFGLVGFRESDPS